MRLTHYHLIIHLSMIIIIFNNVICYRRTKNINVNVIRYRKSIMLSMNGGGTWHLHPIIYNHRTSLMCNVLSCKYDSIHTAYDVRNQNSFSRVFSENASTCLRFNTFACACITVLALQVVHFL